MYSDWASLLPEMQAETGGESVLSRFSENIGRDVVAGIVNNLTLNMGACMKGLEPNILVSEKDVTWTMQIVCFGLSLTSSDNTTLSECVNIYCEWMTCLTEPQKCVPLPLVDEPNRYFCKMLTHLTNLFKARKHTSQEFLKQHTTMCKKVLNTIQTIASKSQTINADSWKSLLKFLLMVCESLLSPPSVKDDLGSQLCERMLSVLFETWLSSCISGNFPSPALWKTMFEMCSGWRHHEALIKQWHKINTILTFHLLKMLYGPEGQMHSFNYSDDPINSLLTMMPNDTMVQCWYRFLNIIGNPVDLSRPRLISSTQQFLHAALACRDVVEPHQHESLKLLPLIFSRAMQSVSFMASAFLGLTHKDPMYQENSATVRFAEQPIVTPPAVRKQRTSFLPHLKTSAKESSRLSIGDSWVNASTPTQTVPSVSSVAMTQSAPTIPHSESNTFVTSSSFRPRVDSLLHLLGSWLLDASLIGVNVLGSSSKEDDWGNESMLPYDTGRAEACGTLCRIFCSVKTEEKILPVYISRFYAALYYGLKVEQERNLTPVLVSIIQNSSNLFKVNLTGIQVLIPQFLKAIEFLQSKFRYKYDKHDADEDVELRHATIQILLSLVCLPLHVKCLPIRRILDDENVPTITFYSLHPRITSLLLKLLEKEIDPVNTQLLLGGLALAVADMASYEEHSPSSEGSNHLYDLYKKSSEVICERMIKSWTTELTSALSSMEVLQFFASLKFLKSRFMKNHQEADDIAFQTSGALEEISKRIVGMICNFVIIQCNKPAPAHSKDLHSSIVSAYQCLTAWLVEHDYLLQDAATLHTILQVTELGISGTRSQAKPSDAPIYKGNKELKPVSLRVKDAAEALLTAIVDHVGLFPSIAGPESLCTLLDEATFLNKFAHHNSKFQYFVIDGSIILGLFEPPAEQQDVSPRIIAIIRSSFGRHAWFLKLCHRTKSKSEQSSSVIRSRTEETHSETQTSNSFPTVNSPTQYFPSSVSQIPPVLADSSIPKIEETMLEYSSELDKLRIIVEEQRKFEEECYSNFRDNYVAPPICEPPRSSNITNAARLFLSHFGFLSLNNLKTSSVTNSGLPALIKLDSNVIFMNDLKHLDRMPVRTADTVHVYYVKAGQNKLEDILSNVLPKPKVHPHFHEFLLSLGWPVDIKNHPGWTGNPGTSWKVQNAKSNMEAEKSEKEDVWCYDGKNEVLYWADVTTELVFIVPTIDSLVLTPDPPKTMSTIDSETSQQQPPPAIQDGDAPKLRRSGRVGASSGNEVQVVVVWLERYEDHAVFPFSGLLKLSNHQQAAEFKGQRAAALNASNFCVIFIHPLQNGLLRIKLQMPSSKMGDAGPLVDKALVCRRTLAHMVRQTAYNVYRRKTLDSDVHQPPHVKRRVFMKEMIQKHHSILSEPDFCTSLFLSQPS